MERKALRRLWNLFRDVDFFWSNRDFCFWYDFDFLDSNINMDNLEVVFVVEQGRVYLEVILRHLK